MKGAIMPRTETAESGSKRAVPVVLCLLVSAVLATTALAQAGRPRIESAYTSDSKETRAERSVFTPDSAKVYVIYVVAELVATTKLKAVWTVEKAEGVQENSKMDESTTSPGAGSFMSAFSRSKPPKGWPVGSYRVELFVDDKLEKTLKFKVAK
jgi:hypothetical protein